MNYIQPCLGKMGKKHDSMLQIEGFNFLFVFFFYHLYYMLPFVSQWLRPIRLSSSLNKTCLWNTDAPAARKSNYGKNLQVLHFDPAPPPVACDVGQVWATLRWTYSPSLVTVWPPKLYILHFVYKRDGITDRQTNGQTIQTLDAPPADLSGQGHKKMIYYQC